MLWCEDSSNSDLEVSPIAILTAAVPPDLNWAN